MQSWDYDDLEYQNLLEAPNDFDYDKELAKWSKLIGKRSYSKLEVIDKAFVDYLLKENKVKELDYERV